MGTGDIVLGHMRLAGSHTNTIEFLLYGSNHWILHQPDRVIKIDLCMASGTKVIFVATGNRLLSNTTNKDGRATGSCFGLIGPHQCGT